MEKACLDTGVLVELARRRLIRYVDRGLGLHLTFITFYEYLRGLAYLGRDLEASKDELENRFQVIWPSNRALMLAAEIYSVLRRKGQLISDPDIIIGSLCISSGAPLATFNKQHFTRLKHYGLELIDPEEVFTLVERSQQSL